MAEKVVSTLKGKIKFETDRSSLTTVRKQIKKLKEEMKGISNPLAGGSSGGGGGNKERRQRADFEAYQKRTIENFKLSTHHIRKMSEAEKKVHINTLKQAKTREQLQLAVRKEKAVISDNLREQKKITREKEKQGLLQRRITSSTEQMVGALGSAFVAVEALQGIVNVGMKFEAFEKTFLAVSDSTEDAKANMQFARDQAMRLGVDLIESGRAYSRMLGSAGDKTALSDIQDAFVAVSEASIAMGLSADDQMGVYRAISQTLAKQKFTAEEVQNQLADRGIPALKVLEQSARDAGLAVDDIGINKLMEQGKLTTDLILPFFAKNLKELANNNDALAKALKENFQPALGRASNTLKDLANDVFQGGLKDGLLFVLNSFTELGQESKGLAQILGSVLGGAVMGLTFPFKLLYAVLLDISDLIGVEMNTDMLKFTSSILGAVAGALLLAKTLKMIGSGAKAIKKVNDALRGNKSGSVKGGSNISSVAKGAAAGAATSVGSIPVTAAALGTGFLLNEAGKAFANTNFAKENTASMMTDLRSRASRFQNSNTMQRVKVDLTMDQNVKEIIDARVDDGIQEQLDGVYNTNGSSKD